MRKLGIHKNIPVSGTELTLGLRVGFISSHLTVYKLFPVNPRDITGPPKMSSLLEAKCIPALIIKPRFTFVAHTDDLGWNKTSNRIYTLSGRIGKVVASYAVVARSSPAEVGLIYTMHVALRGCDQSIGSTISDAIVRSWLWLTATRSSQLGCSVHCCK